MLAGMVVGPSAGYFYGGCPIKGIKGLVIRGGTCALTYYFASSIKDPGVNKDAIIDLSGVGTALGRILVYTAGGIILAAEAAIDVGGVDDAVEDRNYEFPGENSNVSITPKYFAEYGAGGMELNITF